MKDRHLQAIVSEDDFRSFGGICARSGVTKKDLSSALHRAFLSDWERWKSDDDASSRVRTETILSEARS